MKGTPGARNYPEGNNTKAGLKLLKGPDGLLTPRNTRILDLLARGKSPEWIGALMGTHPNFVRHVGHLCGLSDRAMRIPRIRRKERERFEYEVTA